ncbi:hypothetical protein D3C71_911760 [compost metagenome]
MGRAEAGAPFGGEVVDHAGPGGEGLTRRGPVAALGGDIALPDAGRGIARQRPGGEVGLGLGVATDGGAGGAAQAAHLGHALHGRGLLDQGVQHADGLIAQALPHQEAGVGHAGLDGRARVLYGAAAFQLGGGLEDALARAEAVAAQIGPVGDDQGRADGGARGVDLLRGGFQPHGRRGQAQALGPRQGDDVALGLDRQVIGRGLDRQAVGGGQQGQIDGAAAPRHALAGRQGGDGGEAVADHGIGQPDGLGRPGHARGQGGLDAVVTADVHAADGRRGSAQGDDPRRPVGAGGHRLTLAGRNADGGEVGPGGPARLGRVAGLGGGGHVHAGGGVEHHPDRVAATEDGGPDRRGPGEGQAGRRVLDLGGHGHGPAGGHDRGPGALRHGAGGIEVEPDRAVGGAGPDPRPLGQGQDQFGRALHRTGLDLLDPLGRIDLEATDVRGGGRADADDDGAAVLAHPGARTDSPGEFDLGEAGVGADADLDRAAARGGALGVRGQGREHDDARRGGGHGRFQNALADAGPGHTRAPSRERAFIAVNAG